MASKKLPRGVRNHNPGNIERNATRWQGMSADQSGDARFVVFEAPEWGIRALARTLVTYQDKHKLRTVRGIINRWAPPAENATATYIAAVARALRVTADQTIDVHAPATMAALVAAIIRMECANYAYPAAVLAEGLRRAGITGA